MSTLIKGRAALSVHRTPEGKVRISAEVLRELVRDAIQKCAARELDTDMAAVRSACEGIEYGSLEYGREELEQACDEAIDAVAAEISDELYLPANVAVALGQMLIEAGTGPSPVISNYTGTRRREPIGAAR